MNRYYIQVTCDKKSNIHRGLVNGMIGVSKTFGGSSILSSPAFRNAGSLDFFKVSGIFHFPENSYKE